MRKLLATVAASTAIILATSVAGASSTSVSYTDKHQTYTLCVTNGGSGDLGYDNLLEIDFQGLTAQPTSITTPANWTSATYSNGSTWTAVLYTNNPATGLGTSTTANCGFSFKVAGAKKDHSAHTTQLYFYSSNGTLDPNDPITVTAL